MGEYFIPTYLNIAISGTIMGLCWERIGTMNLFFLDENIVFWLNVWDYAGIVLGMTWEYVGNDMFRRQKGIGKGIPKGE
jgi:hypothetical protein|tara:strand:+ start:502 stop:738 length:237 start_codon:yes stop_codon:yes gene_type:complete